MARRSGSSRILACILVGLGVFLVVAAILVPTYTVDTLKKIPLDLEVTTVAEGPGDVLNATALIAGKAQVNTNVPIVAQRYVTVEDPSDADKVTLQAGLTLRRIDMQGSTGLITATVDRVTLDRVTAMPIDDPIGSLQVSATAPAEELSHTGLQYKFPFDAQQQSYPFFDLTARQSFDINFVEETEINGTKVYHYNQKVGPVDLSKVTNDPANKLALPADTWGVPGGQLPITMTRWYQVERDVWVEPQTGVIVKGQEQLYQYYARSADKPEVTVLKTTLPFNEQTIENQLAQAKDGMDKLSLFGRILPIIAGILGILALIAGIIIGLRGGRGPKQPAAPGGPDSPSDSGYEYSGDAPTEKQHDWTSDRTEEIPLVDPTQPGHRHRDES